MSGRSLPEVPGLAERARLSLVIGTDPPYSLRRLAGPPRTATRTNRRKGRIMPIDITKAIALITDCSDPEKLKRMAANARRLGEWT